MSIQALPAELGEVASVVDAHESAGLERADVLATLAASFAARISALPTLSATD